MKRQAMLPWVQAAVWTACLVLFAARRGWRRLPVTVFAWVTLAFAVLDVILIWVIVKSFKRSRIVSYLP